MSPTNVELYEALKPTVGEEAARMIAEIFPQAREIATKTDVDAVRREVEVLRSETRAEFAEVRGEMREGFAKARAENQADRVSMLKWLIALMLPVWLGSWGTVIAILLKN